MQNSKDKLSAVYNEERGKKGKKKDLLSKFEGLEDLWQWPWVRQQGPLITVYTSEIMFLGIKKKGNKLQLKEN